MKFILKSYWTWFYIVAIIITAIDYIDHLTRSDPFFLQNKFDWFLFTVASALATFLTIEIVKWLTIKLFKTTNLILESIAIIMALMMHIYVTGPLNNGIFFSQSDLYFFPKVVTFVIALSVFYITRLLFYLFSKFNFKSANR